METNDNNINNSTQEKIENTISAELHLFDSKGNHTGPIYDNLQNLIYFENLIPGSYYGILNNNKQFIYLEYADNLNYVYKLKQKEDGINKLSLLSCDTTSNNIFTHQLNDQLQLTAGDSLQAQINLIKNNEGIIVPDSIQAKALCNNYVWQKNWDSDDNFILNVYLGNLTLQTPIYNFIDTTSIKMNDTLSPLNGSIAILDSFTNYNGKVLKIEF